MRASLIAMYPINLEPSFQLLQLHMHTANKGCPDDDSKCRDGWTQLLPVAAGVVGLVCTSMDWHPIATNQRLPLLAAQKRRAGIQEPEIRIQDWRPHHDEQNTDGRQQGLKPAPQFSELVLIRKYDGVKFSLRTSFLVEKWP